MTDEAANRRPPAPRSRARLHQAFVGLLIGLCLNSTVSAEFSAKGVVEGPAQVARSGERPPLRTLVMGRGHVCATEDGHVTCWGLNDDDQLGDGFRGFSAAAIEGPSKIGSGHGDARVVELVAAADATCARSAAGRVVCWGAGDASEAEVDGLDDALELTAKGTDVCARRQTGQVVCWDKSDYVSGAAGGRRITAHTAAKVRGVVALVAPGEARNKDGRAIRWNLHPPLPCKPSANRPCPPEVVPGTATITEPPLPSLPPTSALVSGSAHGCALLRDGHVRCWSQRNRHGQVGDGTTLPRPDPVEVAGLDDAVEIGATGNHTCARRRSGDVVCWGENHSGEVGASALRDQPAPVAVEGIHDATHLVLGDSHSCALRKAGGFACWGWGEEGQLFDASLMRTQPWSPLHVSGISGAAELTAGTSHTCVRHEDGSVQCWGRPRPDKADACHPEIDGLVCQHYGTGCGGRIYGHVDTYASPQRIKELRAVVAVDARSDRTCAIERGGRVRCFNRQGPCGGGDETEAWPEDVAKVPDAVEVALGGTHDCVRTRSGQVVCWGENASGQLGDGSLDRRAGPVPVVGINDATMLALGRQHACALLREGRVACWGHNVTGQLGTGNREPAQRAAVVAGLSDVVELRAGDWHTCARKRDGAVWCWGENDRGSLGDRTTTDRLVPVEVKGLPPATALAASGSASCARSTTGAVSCWGEVAGLPNQDRPILRFNLRATAPSRR